MERSSLTDPVSRLSADGGRALDVGSGGRHVVVPAQLGEEVLDQIDEDQVPAGHHEVAQGHDGPLKQSQSHNKSHNKSQHRATPRSDPKVSLTFLTASRGDVS